MRTLLIGATIGIAVLLGVARVLLPAVEGLRPEVEVWVSGLVDRTVHIGALSADWQGWTPVLRLEDVRLLDRDGQAELARFARAHVAVDLLGSLVHGSLRAGELGVTGAMVTVTRRRDGALFIAGKRPEGGLGAWLLAQSELALEAASVVWHDRRAGLEPVTLSAVNVHMRNDGGRHRVSGTGALPSGFGERVSFAAELHGDVRSPDWSGTVFLRGEGIASKLWRPLLEGSPTHFAGGVWSFSLWSTWRQASLERVRGQVHFRDVLLEAGDGALALDAGGGRLLLRRAAPGWQLDLTELELTTPRGRWPSSGATLRMGADADAPDARRYRGTLGFLRLEDVLALVPGMAPPGELVQTLTRLAPRGELHDIAFALTQRPGESADFQVAAALHAVSIQPTDEIPGLAGLAGRLEVAPDRARLELDAEHLDARWPGMFPGPLAARVSGQVEWHREAAGWRLEVPQVAASNPDLDARLSGRLDARPGESPTMTLVAELRDADLPALRAYIPQPVVPESFARWSEHAFQAGRVESASLLVQGRLADFPFDGPDGTFQLHTEIRDGLLRYAREWPALEAYSGTLEARGRDLTMRLTEGTITGVRVLGAEAHIRGIGEVEPPILELSGRLQGDANQGLAYLRSSPLRTRFEALTTGLEASGEMRVDLRLALPLGRDKAKGEREVHGALHFANSRVIGRRLDVTFEEVNGTVRFGSDGLSAEGIGARYLGRKVTVGIEQAPPPGRRVRVRLEGAAGPDFIGAQLRKLGMSGGNSGALAALLPRVRGVTRWRATLQLPARADDAIGVHFESSLAGLALDLPDPLGKPQGEARGLVLDATVDADVRRLLHLRYGAGVKAALAFAHVDGALRLQRGAVRLGEGDPTLPADAGISVRGRSPELSIEPWFRLLRELGPAPAAGAAKTRRLGAKTRRPLLNAVDLNIARLDLFGQRFRDVHLDARPQPGGAAWVSELRGDDIAGSVRIPTAPSPREPLVLRFERLALRAPAESAGGARHDPRKLPPLDFSSEQLAYHDIELGRVTLEASPFERGLRIDRFAVRSPGFDASAQGTWRYADGMHESRSSLHVQSSELAPLLETFGYTGGAVEGGKTTIQIDAAWPGTPTDFTLRHLTGTMDFRITDGRLVEVEKGTTERLFGLLSVQLLPKRLMLDFSDLFTEGVRYETIKGTFDIASGTAYTTDLLMRGPSVRVEVRGRVDLADKTYDQTMTVIPKLTSTLPLAPVWLAQKLLDAKFFDRSFARRYKITGTWEDPRVALIEEKHTPISPFER